MRSIFIESVWLASIVAAGLLSACGGGNGGDRISAGSGTSNEVLADFHTKRTESMAAGQFEMLTLSTLPDAVTGGDVLVGLRGLAAGDAFSVSRNGADVSTAFHRLENGEIHGLVTGLREGSNTLIASAKGRSARLTIKNHPITGPVISGPHQTPFICRTEDADLGAPLDENCSVETRHQWFYRSVITQGFTELTDPYASYPPDVIQTETVDGRAVPFVVRVESATINRGIVRIGVLDDPAARGPDAPFDARNWSHRVFHAFGESCGVGYQQGVNDPTFVLGGVPDPSTVSADRLLINLAGGIDRLNKGDAVVHSTLAAFGVHCNPLISAESTTMIKEHINEQYGLVEYYVGTNGSGAALQQYNLANNAPGVLSAAMPTATFADIVTTAMTVSDCGLLQHYYENSALDWNDQKKAAVNGHNLLSGNQLNAICQSWTDAFFSRVKASEACDGSIPDELIYHPETNPRGVRCTIQDANINIFGRDPATGFARRPLDNVGIQYGLDALNNGAISFDEFLDLNRSIGGLDIDGNFIPERHAMDAQTEALTYRIGGVIGRGALAETPVMDLAPYLDLIPVANIHEAVRPFIVRARLRKYSGQDVTQSIWRGVVTQPDAYPVMEQWITALRDARPAPGGDHVQAVMSSKPAAAQDSCVVGTVGGRVELPDAIQTPLGLIQVPLLVAAPLPDIDVPLRLAIPEDFDSGLGLCQIALPVTRTPRMVAGMPMSDDVIKCQLKSVAAADYSAALSETQLAQIRAVFPEGVCDYSKPAAGALPEGEHSLIWPSVGGKTLKAPHELKWRVARSS
ncbi:MAG: DUF6351 family protein [Nevskiales bacterium]